MHIEGPRRGWMKGLVVAVAAGALAAAGLAIAAAPAYAAPAAAGAKANPYSPASGHPYRHGVVATQAVTALMRAHPQVLTGPNDLNYGGGVDGIGVTTGHEKVYLVFWGSQWGTAGTDANGNTTFSGDGVGEAPRLQQLFKGLGTGNELWSGVMTQYCQGVAAGAQSCPSSSTQREHPPLPEWRCQRSGGLHTFRILRPPGPGDCGFHGRDPVPFAPATAGQMP